MKLPSLVPVCLLVGSSTLLSISAPAALFETESFDYPAAAGAGLNGLAGGTGWNGAWSDTDSLPTLGTTSDSLNYPANVPLAETGGRIELTLDSVNNPAGRFLGTSMDLSANSQTFYSSALFRRSAVTGELASVLFDRSSDSAIRWYYGIDANGFFSVAVDPSNASQRATSTFAAEADTTYLLVAQIRTNTGPGGNDQVFLRVFAEGSVVSEPTSDAGWDLTASGNSGVVLNHIRLGFSNVAGQTNQFDELRVGTSFADVTGIPEPGSASLLAFGTLVLGYRRRR